MTRSRRRLTGLVALLGLVASAANAETVVKHRHVARRPAAVAREPSFPVYIDQGSDRSPGTDDRYFSDTRNPHYLQNPGSYLIGPGWFQRWWGE